MIRLYRGRGFGGGRYARKVLPDTKPVPPSEPRFNLDFNAIGNARSRTPVIVLPSAKKLLDGKALLVRDRHGQIVCYRLLFPNG